MRTLPPSQREHLLARSALCRLQLRRQSHQLRNTGLVRFAGRAIAFIRIARSAAGYLRLSRKPAGKLGPRNH